MTYIDNARVIALARSGSIATTDSVVVPDEKNDADIIPDETPPLPPDEPVKTDPIPEEAP